MTNLIDELKGEHCAIVATLEKVKTAGIASIEGQAILQYGRLCARLSQRIYKEEKILYEEYAKSGKTTPGLNSLRA
jgi:hypothetical protein